MTLDRYQPVPLDLDATRARWMKRKGFRVAYDALADEFATLNELLGARKAAGMTQADVAEHMGIAQASVARLEVNAGSRKHAPSVATLRRYADAVGCDLHISLAARTRPGAASPARSAKRKPARPAKKRKAATKPAAKRTMKAMRSATAKKSGSATKRTATKRPAKRRARA